MNSRNISKREDHKKEEQKALGGIKHSVKEKSEIKNIKVYTSVRLLNTCIGAIQPDERGYREYSCLHTVVIPDDPLPLHKTL